MHEVILREILISQNDGSAVQELVSSAFRKQAGLLGWSRRVSGGNVSKTVFKQFEMWGSFGDSKVELSSTDFFLIREEKTLQEI